MELLFLGTGGGVPSKHRNVTSIALIMPENQGKIWLFDCGEATQHQILHTKVTLSKIDTIFITHLHGDHIFGLPGLLGSRSFQGATEPLKLIGPKGIKSFVDIALAVSSTHLRYELIIHEIDAVEECHHDEKFIVETKRLSHAITSYGFRIVEKDQPGKLLVEKLKGEGILPGPIYKKIKRNQVTLLPNGRKINRDDYLGPTKKGRIITILGDTRPSEASVYLARGAHVLVHEATFDKDKQQLAHDYYHSTTEQAATVAKLADVDTLIVTHLSSRYQDGEAHDALLAEVQKTFRNAYLASDLWSFTFDRLSHHPR